MFCKEFWKRTVSFALALSLSLIVVNLLQIESTGSDNRKNIKPFNKCVDKEKATDLDNKPAQKTEAVSFSTNELPSPEFAGINSVIVDSAPLPKYTDAAREQNIQGKVVLQVKFLASGKIGIISVIKNLPFGLTEQAISAAKQIKFKPAKTHGRLQDEIKTIEYTFTIY